MELKTVSKGIIVLFLVSSLITPFHLTADSVTMSEDEYIDITVDETWSLLSNSSNGIQHPVDVRTDGEWLSERIDTPFPEFPRQFEQSEIFDEEGYQEFVNLYNGSDIIVYCKSGGRSSSAASYIVSRGFNGTVYNMLGGITDWKNKGYPTKNGNTEPNTPMKPDGDSYCTINEPYIFTTQTTDPDDDPIRYGWDINSDGYVDKWTPFTTSSSQGSLEHTFTYLGIFNISVLAQDNVGSVSSLSEKLTVEVNTPPTTPTINGEEEGKINTNYEYTIMSTDTDGDEISYFIEWGDGTTEGWTRTLPSGEPLTVSHEWEEKNTYELRVQAKDEHGATSDWSTLELQMPKTKLYLWLNQFFEQHPILEQLFSSIF